MNVEELISKLQDFPPSAEVRLATQPSYPFENSITEVGATNTNLEVLSDDEKGHRQWFVVDNDYDPEDEDEFYTAGPYDDPRDAEKAIEEMDSVVYIFEGRQIGYLPGNVRNLVGW